jgi:hypothetical protein
MVTTTEVRGGTVDVSAAEARTYPMDDTEAETTLPAEIELGPGVRLVDGRLMYSAAWLDFEAPRDR